MRIAYLSADFGVRPGGANGPAVHVRETLAALRRRGHVVQLVSPHAPRDGHGPLDGIGADLPDLLVGDRGLPSHLGKELRSLLLSNQTRVAARAELERFAPDVIYERYSLFGHGGVDVAADLGVPLILEVNAPLSHEQGLHRELVMRDVAAELEARIWRAADAVFVVSNVLRERARRLGVAAERVVVCPNGVDPQRFHPGVSGAAVRMRLGLEGKAVVGFVGSLKPWHDVPTLAAAIDRLAASRPDVHLLVVGDGPHRAQLREDILPVTVTGSLAHEDVPAHVAAMDVVVVPGSQAAGNYFSPLKLFEAMAMGKPVVGAALGQIREVLESEMAGLTYEPRSAPELASRIDEILGMPDRGAALGAGARKAVLERWTWDRNAERIEAVAQRLVRATGGGRVTAATNGHGDRAAIAATAVAAGNGAAAGTELAATDTSAVGRPAADTSAAETPAANTSAADTPAADTPAADTPAADTPPAVRPADVATWRSLLRLRRFVAPHWRVLALGLVLLAGIAAMDLLVPWPLKVVFDDIIGQPLDGATLRLLTLVALAVVAIPALQGLFSYLLVYFLNRAGRMIVFDIRAALFDHVQRLSLQFHSRRSTGDLLARLTSDTKQIRSVFTDWMAEVINSTLFVVGMAVVLVVLDWQLGLITIASMPVLFLALRRFAWRIREYSRQERAREGALATVAHEALGTVKLTHAFGREEVVRRRFQDESAESLRSGVAAALSEERFAWVTDVLAGMAVAAVLWVGARRVAAGDISAGTLIVFVAYARAFYKPMRSATKNATRITRAVASVERVLELLEVEEGIVDRADAREAPRLRGEIEFRNVSFAYDPGRAVLHDVSLVIPAGKVTAVVGATGAGKSTLTALVPRLYDPTAGAVLVDGVDVREYTVRSLRAQLSVVLQESVLLSASIAENIAYGRPSARFVEIVSAARAASAHEFIMALPQGYDTVVGERGETLSGGQRQRIAIARALLRDAPILILDEPLTGLDAQAAAAVLEGLKRRTKGKTMIVITHDHALAAQADAVVVLAGGRLVQQEGAPEEALR